LAFSDPTDKQAQLGMFQVVVLIGIDIFGALRVNRAAQPWRLAGTPCFKPRRVGRIGKAGG
jgi:hypothetical protein